MNAQKPALRLLIVDDEAPARRRLRELLADCASVLPVDVVGEAGNGLDALRLLDGQPADVVLADIRMPSMGGIELARHLQQLPEPPAIIFTTAYGDFAIQAFEANAVDYLLKPVRAERLVNGLRKARALQAAAMADLSQVAGARAHLSIVERGKIVLIPVNEVIYLKAELKYVTVRTCDREYLIEESLTRLEREHAERFVRIHRNCLVARAHLAGFEKASAQSDKEDTAGHWVAVLKGLDETLPVSRRHIHVLRDFKP
ncbi:MAG: LytTR family DNA-binding domain-containing protein [Betaproteobacteria bacterium]|nr:LytTR family DNA-binding domain-containing protein [Betaproteobacteria bacterium]